MSRIELFHAGELAIQKRAGVGERTIKFAERTILDHMSPQQQDFFPQLNTLFVASIDAEDKLWASVLIGHQGFVQTPDSKHLLIDNTLSIDADPLNQNLKLGKPLGFLGLEFHSRRRNRLAGNLVDYQHKQMMIEITQAFGNCPKYIQTRKLTIAKQVGSFKKTKEVEYINRFTKKIESMIKSADTFFIASSVFDNGSYSADLSHRGGHPGFVKIESDRVLSFDDYPGNNFYMTLGNLLSNPICGLLFLDFESGDILQLSCQCEIIETPQSKNARKMKLTLEHGQLIKAALPVEWELCEYSPFLQG